jgi:hypothetical protein
MTPLSALWLPVLASAVIVFVVSSIIHMASPWHKNDFPRMPREDDVMDALRPLAIPPDTYFIPRPSSREGMRAPEFKEKVKKGPVVAMTVFPYPPMSMATNLALWFLFIVAVSLCAAYAASNALDPGGEAVRVFKFVAFVAFMGYSVALWPQSIWYRWPWRLTIKATVDGLVYALVTGAVFGWLWPK